MLVDFKEPQQSTLKQVGQDTSIRILTFNILSTVDIMALTQGYPIWAKRRKLVFKIMDETKADFIAVQECSGSQLSELATHLKKYNVIDHRSKTSDSVLFYHSENFKLKAKGSITLEEITSATIPRAAVWGHFAHTRTKKELLVVATHLDAKSFKIRESKKLAKFCQKIIQTDFPLLVAGDFNIDPKETEYQALIAKGLINSQAEISEDFNTFPVQHLIRRVDHVFYAGSQVKVTDWQVLDNPSPHYSDHRPVQADFFITGMELSN